MRKIDVNKSSAFGKAAKTISFDKVVLDLLEKKAKEDLTTASNIVNMRMRQVLNDREYNRMMAKHHYMKFQEYKYLADELVIEIE